LIHFVPPESVVPPAVNVIVSPRHAGSALVVIVPPLSAPLSKQASQAWEQQVPSAQHSVPLGQHLLPLQQNWVLPQQPPDAPSQQTPFE